jgi:hypothetical protein
MLGLKEKDGQRYFKYEDRLIDGVSIFRPLYWLLHEGSAHM